MEKEEGECRFSSALADESRAVAVSNTFSHFCFPNPFAS